MSQPLLRRRIAFRRVSSHAKGFKSGGSSKNSLPKKKQRGPATGRGVDSAGGGKPDMESLRDSDGQLWTEKDDEEMRRIIGPNWKEEMQKMIDNQESNTDNKASSMPTPDPHLSDQYGPLALGVTAVMAESHAIVANSTLRRCEWYLKNILDSLESTERSVPTIRALDETLASLHTTLDGLGVLNRLYDDPDCQSVTSKSCEELAIFEQTVRLDPRIAAAVESELNEKEDSFMSMEERELSKRWIRDFKASSYAMDTETQMKTRALLPALAEQMGLYVENMYKHNATVEIPSDMAVFLPTLHQRVIKMNLGLDDAAPIPRGQNLTLPANAFFAEAIVRYVPFAKIRQETYQKFESIQENRQVLQEILSIRSQLAQLYGYETYSHLATNESVFKSPDETMEFLLSLSEKVLPRAEIQMKILKNVKRQAEGDDKIDDWDVEYYLNKAMGMFSNIDANKVEEYFPIDVCVDGVRNVAEKLFGLKFYDDTKAALEEGDIWDASVVRLNVKNGANDTIGYIYLDLFERAFKPPEPATLRARATYTRGEKLRPARVVISTSFSQVTDQPNVKPILLSHEELRILFHEFGHCMHEILSTSETYCGAGCLGVATNPDAFEIPAVLMELFAWDPRVLGTFATHYQTRQPPPDAVLDDLTGTRKSFAAIKAQEKIAFSILDQEFHANFKSTKEEDAIPFTSTKSDEVFAEHFPVKRERNPYGGSWETKWAHVSNQDYAASYFTYVLADVLSYNIWSNLFENDPLSEEAGKKFQEAFLAPGCTRSTSDSLKLLLGDETLNPQSWLASLGC